MSKKGMLMSRLNNIMKKLNHLEKILYLIIGTVLFSATVYLIIYVFYAPFIPAIVIHFFYILLHVYLLLAVKNGQLKFAKYTIILTFLVQLSLAVFIWFPKSSNYGLFYYLVPIASFAVMDMSNKKEKLFSIVISLIAIALYFISAFFTLSTPMYELTPKAEILISSFSVFSTIAPATIIFYLYAVGLSKKQSELEYLANTDVLTQAATRRIFFELGQKEFELSKKYKHNFTLFAMDLDSFKSVNDTYGHAAGDVVLIEFAEIVRSVLRKEDTFARNGGEEFAVITRRTSFKDSYAIAEKIRKAVEESDFEFEDQLIKITVSIGVVISDKDFKDFGHLFKTADDALYEAKKQGRNRVVVANQDWNVML